MLPMYCYQCIGNTAQTGLHALLSELELAPPVDSNLSARALLRARRDARSAVPLSDWVRDVDATAEVSAVTPSVPLTTPAAEMSADMLAPPFLIGVLVTGACDVLADVGGTAAAMSFEVTGVRKLAGTSPMSPSNLARHHMLLALATTSTMSPARNESSSPRFAL